MSHEPGTKLGPYEIVSPIGSGGMGEVYRARDTRLGRDVAIKVLPEELAKDKDRLTRFEREAKLLASLNHPNVATLYGFEDDYLVMELVEGETLAERIAGGPIPVEEALICTSCGGARGSARAGGDPPGSQAGEREDHARGEGEDSRFRPGEGLFDRRRRSAEMSQSPTLTKGTALGTIMGTAAYMSPEQARGKKVDQRTDIWAFGCCLYEAVTGSKAFDGETVADTIGAVVNREPDWSRLPSVIEVADLDERFSHAHWLNVTDVLPDGTAALAVLSSRSVSADYADIHAVSLETREMTLLIRNGFGAHHLASGHIAFARGGTLHAVSYDPETREILGEPFPIVDDMRMESLTGQVQFAVSENGALVYVPGADVAVGKLAWVDRMGSVEFLPVPERAYVAPKIAPDGLRVAVDVADVSDYIWIWDILGPATRIVRYRFHRHAGTVVRRIAGRPAYPSQQADRRGRFHQASPRDELVSCAEGS